MSESAKRTIRTAYVVLTTLAVALPALATAVPHHTPAYQLLAGFAGAVVVANRAITFLEDRGVLPAFLRNVEPRLDVVDAIASAAADAAAAAPQLAATVEGLDPALTPAVEAVADAAPAVASAAAAVQPETGPAGDAAS